MEPPGRRASQQDSDTQRQKAYDRNLRFQVDESLLKTLTSGKMRLLSIFWPKGNFIEPPWAKQHKNPKADGAYCFVVKPNRKEGEKEGTSSFISNL